MGIRLPGHHPKVYLEVGPSRRCPVRSALFADAGSWDRQDQFGDLLGLVELHVVGDARTWFARRPRYAPDGVDHTG
jgi:hypothetical protein